VIAILGRRTVAVKRCNELAESHSLVKVDRPESIANDAVALDRIAAIEQSH
jgi:hypothetical protein